MCILCSWVMDEWMDGWMDGLTDGLTDGWTDGLTDRRDMGGLAFG